MADTVLYQKKMRGIDLGTTIDEVIVRDAACLHVPSTSWVSASKDIELSYLYNGAVTAEDINQ